MRTAKILSLVLLSTGCVTVQPRAEITAARELERTELHQEAMRNLSDLVLAEKIFFARAARYSEEPSEIGFYPDGSHFLYQADVSGTKVILVATGTTASADGLSFRLELSGANGQIPPEVAALDE